MNPDSCGNSGLALSTIRELADAWDDLISGRSQILAADASRQHHFIDLADRPSDQSWPLDARSVDFLRMILSGSPQKVVAAVSRRAPSTVSAAMQRGTRAFGLACGSRYVPMVLVVMHRTWLTTAREATPVGLREAAPSRRICIDRPDACLEQLLSPSEYDVTQSLIDGLSHQEIALQRQTSKRTIANQVASVYQKLGMSGRIELMSWLAARSLENRAAFDAPSGVRDLARALPNLALWASGETTRVC